jgi:hypothetical protein
MKVCKSLINIAYIKEKVKCEFSELKSIYETALEKAKLAKSNALQVMILLSIHIKKKFNFYIIYKAKSFKFAK